MCSNLGRVSDIVPVRTWKVHLPPQNLVKQVLLLISLTTDQSRRTQIKQDDLTSDQPLARLVEDEETAPSEWGEPTQEDVGDDACSPNVHFQTIPEEPRAER